MKEGTEAFEAYTKRAEFLGKTGKAVTTIPHAVLSVSLKRKQVCGMKHTH